MATTVDTSAERALDLAERLVSVPSRRGRFSVWTAITYIALSVGAFCMVVPFFWMLLTSLKPAPELVMFSFWPQNPTLSNYITVLQTNDFARWYFNSVVVACFSTLCVAIFDSLVGYTLNKFTFPGKNIIFLAILATLMVPTEMLIIPWYTMSVKLNWHVGLMQYWGIAFPGVITATGIFLMRQFFDSVPNELLDAARIDGLNEPDIWWRIAMPLVKPALAALCIFNFIGNWNAYIWPLIIASGREYYTLPIGLKFFRGEATSSWELIMAGSSLSTAPLIIMFLLFQRQIIKGIALTGLKG